MNIAHAPTAGDARKAHFTPLSPISFLPRTALAFPDHVAIVHGDLRQTWSETYRRCRQLASAFRGRGIGKGDVIAVIAPNIPAMYEAHFAVPMAGAILNTLNTRLKAAEIAFQLRHGGARVLLVDREFSELVASALRDFEDPPLVIDVLDETYDGAGQAIGATDYERLLAEGSDDFEADLPEDECEPISLNYTSGTTGDPKGVVTHHRGAHLNALSQIVTWSMPQNPVYLWTLPMFHCNGWCFPWAVAIQGGTNICVRRVEPARVVDLIELHGVSHMCGAPIVYSMLVDELERRGRVLSSRVDCMIAGAAPPSALIEAGDRMGFDFLHVYGLTEVYGPAAVCVKQPGWADMPVEDRARLNARQGMAMVSQEAMCVLDPEKMEPVPADGETQGEIMFRGNATLLGYLNNPEATAAAFGGGWFHTGDIAVVDPDGYVRITDRSKDVIISGGENISSLEVEDVLHKHPAVSVAAVVAMPHEKWGEVPCAFIELRAGEKAEPSELQQFCRERLAAFKVPKVFSFEELPKTSTGKVQKAILRDAAGRLVPPA
ncbi:AMP-binding protein [Croceicoccus mobilis]|uniref:3-methylmercaptopropionyl-CoA ligase n=1 Tax=Croceicoccus mobilis TaxID=1703339 RepID=A0A916Z6J2_9SPHN|nr:AMP-binding protein [Croceicoccus mobilis]GGD77242.1 acyl-CoA synthetase [Croceicoccus mobilis]